VTRSSSARRLEDKRIISTTGSASTSTPWYSQSGAVALSSKSCIDPVNSHWVPWQNFGSRRSPGPSERIGDRGNVNYIEPHPPQPSSVPVSRNRPARAFLCPLDVVQLALFGPRRQPFMPWP
jgi:hypothetical protein